MTVIGRILAIFFGLIVAALAGGLVLMLGAFLPESSDLLADMDQQGMLGPMIGIVGVVVWGVTLVPAVVVVIFLELLSVRSVVIYGLIGAGLAAMFLFGGGFLAVDDTAARALFTRANEVVIGAGVAAGFAYWLIAGRNAGRWRRL
jgi:hypothetical protein